MGKKFTLKTFSQKQLNLLTPSYDDLVATNHPVRVVNYIIDRLDINALEKEYKGKIDRFKNNSQRVKPALFVLLDVFLTSIEHHSFHF